MDRRPGPRPITEQAISQGYRPSPLHEAARRIGDNGKLPPPRKTAAGNRHSVGVDRASTVLIPTATSHNQREALVTDVRRKVYDPVTSNAPVTERGKEKHTAQGNEVQEVYGTSKQQPLRTSRFEGEIERPVTISIPVCADKSSVTSHAGVKGEVSQYCSKESVKNQGTAKADGRPSTASITRGDEVSMAPVIPGLWHEIIEEGGVILQQVELPEVRGNECETVPLIANTPSCLMQMDTPHPIPSYQSVEQEANSVESVETVQMVSNPRVAPVKGVHTSLYVSGSVEGQKVRFLVDTGAEVSVISQETLQRLPTTVRQRFESNKRKLVTASGEEVEALGPVLCSISVQNRTVTDTVYAAPFPEAAIMGITTLVALGCQVTVAGVDVVKASTNTAVQSLYKPRVHRVTAVNDVTVPAQSEILLVGQIQHRPGRSRDNADGLSRQLCGKCDRECERVKVKSRFQSTGSGANPSSQASELSTRKLKETVRLLQVQMQWVNEELEDFQVTTQHLQPLLTTIRSQVKPGSVEEASWPPMARRYLQDWDRLTFENEVLRRRWYSPSGQVKCHQVIATRPMITAILKAAHEAAGHFGVKRTTERIRDHFHWVGLEADVRSWLKSCDVCGARRGKPTRAHHPYERQAVSEPLQRVAMDLLGPLDETERGNKYILVVVDYLSKWVEGYPLKDMTATTCADVVTREFVCRYGFPLQVHSDQGRQFESALFQEVCRLMNVSKSRTTPLHPQSDGQTERANKTILDLLAKLVATRKEEWDLCLPIALSLYRSSVHSVTGETPNRLMLGREVRTPVTLLAPLPPGQEYETDWGRDFHARFGDMHQLVTEVTKQKHRAEAPRHDRRCKNLTFNEGDLVWVYDPKQRRGKTPKLDPNRWSGPWKITRKVSKCTYCVKHQITKRDTLINVDRMWPYNERDGDRFPVGQNQDTDERSEVSNEDQNANEDDRAERESEVIVDRNDELSEQEEQSPTSVTRRARRNRKTPRRLEDYDIN